MNRFFTELKRRHVYRVGIAYAVAAWLLLQLAAIVLPTFGAPHWVLKVLIAIFVIFFLIALIIAWAFEVTPEGVRRTEAADSEAARPERTHRRVGHTLTIITLVVLAAAVGVLVWQLSTKSRPAPAVAVAPRKSVAAPVTATAIPAKSIAVLPFENLSTDKGNAYFADGMQDLILTKLADIGDLKVISRTSTENYGSHPGNLKVIAQQLGVATILEGSVQKAGNQVLINVQLIDANTDSHIWGQSYQRTLDNIFGVEGEVAQKVADALNAKLTTAQSAAVAKVPTQNAAALELYLKGEYRLHHALDTLQQSDFEAAAKYYRQAVAQDPKFALAWARLSITLSSQVEYNPYEKIDPAIGAQAKTALDRALALAPESVESRLAEGRYRAFVLRDLNSALTSFKAALIAQPDNVQALFAVGKAYLAEGQVEKAVPFLQKAVELAPRDTYYLEGLASADLTLRRYADAEQAARRALAIDPADTRAELGLAGSYLMSGDLDRAEATLDAAPASTQANSIMEVFRLQVLLFRRDYAAARKLSFNAQNNGGVSAPYFVMLRGDVEWYAGNHTQARAYYQRAVPLVKAELKKQPNSANFHGDLAWIYARLGRTTDALKQATLAVKLAKGLEFGSRNADFNWWRLACIQAELGHVDAAVATLDQLMASPAGNQVSEARLRLDPALDPIRHDPRFQALLKKYAQYKPAAAATVGQG